MIHLVKIFDDVLTISRLRKKMKNDPMRSPIYEGEMWKLYTRITEHKNRYYQDRINTVPTISSAYVTFRSMEGKERAMQAYETGRVIRWIAEYVCCMGSLFKKKKLLQKGYLRMKEAHDPEILIWENTGQSFWRKFFIGLTYLFFACVFIALGFSTFWGTAQVEKLRNEYIKGDCKGQDFYS